jgi:hypothetical protein
MLGGGKGSYKRAEGFFEGKGAVKYTALVGRVGADQPFRSKPNRESSLGAGRHPVTNIRHHSRPPGCRQDLGDLHLHASARA